MSRLLALVPILLLVGCTTDTMPEPKKASPPKSVAIESDGEDEIRATLAKLDPEDRKAAEAQKWCAVATKSRLGDMGVPYKLVLNGQPVFLCCKHCKKEAETHPEQTLADVARLREKAAADRP